MLSPFPGMDPYLETPELWSAVHSRLIVAMADTLVDQLSERYRVEVEKRTYFSSEADSVLVGLPDVAILKTRSLEAERVEVLRGGQLFPIAPQSSGDYHILISRSPQHPTADLYVFSLRQTIPVVPVPLLEPDPEPLLNLQQLLAYVYDRGRYHLAIDYCQPLSPPLTEADRQWL